MKKPTSADLVRSTYGEHEGARMLAFEPTTEDVDAAIEAGRIILERSQPFLGACTYLSAACTLMHRTAFELPVYCVAGDLRAHNLWAFQTSGADISRQLGGSNDQWDGHCWIQLGRYKIGDISLCRTAHLRPEGSNINAAVVELFGPQCELFIETRSWLLDAELEYMPNYVLSDRQMELLVESAIDIGHLLSDGG